MLIYNAFLTKWSAKVVHYVKKIYNCFLKKIIQLKKLYNLQYATIYLF